MANIDAPAFAQKIEDYLRFYRFVKDESMCALYDIYSKEGISFGYETELVMQLLKRAYDSLSDVNPKDFAEKVSKAMQEFAEPFPREACNLCYPHFLLHGIDRPSLDDVVNKIGNNSRIIHETIAVRNQTIDDFGVKDTNAEIKLAMTSGSADDYFGIAFFIFKSSGDYFSGKSKYIAKTSFFLDTTNKEIYVITIQGRRFELTKGYKESKRANGKMWGQLTSKLGMDPRAFLLTELKKLGIEKGYGRIKVIRPNYHPMFIEKHKGFLATYEPAILKAGINKENECYLEAELGELNDS